MSGNHFDAMAGDWDQDEAKVARAETIAGAITRAVPLGAGARLLEYGAGTGLVAQALTGHVGAVTLADSSTGMRQVMHEKVAAGMLPGARVWDLDLETQPAPAERFDLVVTSLVLHHVRELDRVLAGFAELLAPGGHVCIADLDREDGSFHSHDFDVHHGFDRAELTERLHAAGLTDVSVRDCTELVREGVTYSVFLAVAGAQLRAAAPASSAQRRRRW